MWLVFANRNKRWEYNNMEFDESGNPQHPHKLTFEGEEVGVVRAVFRELIYNLALKGNSGSISSYDAKVANWEDYSEDERRAVLVHHYENIVERLEEFHENTDDAISEIPDITGQAPFLNEEISLRHELGERALILANQIRGKASEHFSRVKPDVDVDKEFSGLLGGEQSSS